MLSSIRIERGTSNMIHPHTELRYINGQIGFGVFATKLIPKGTITWALDELDQILNPSFVNSLDPERYELVMKYSYRDENGKYVLSWDLGRYVNHSFNANCIGTAYEVDIAVRDIQSGEELTNDYGSLNLDEPLDCVPEEGIGRTRAMPDDMLRYYRRWDELVLDALRFFDKVEQPLAHLILPEYIKKMRIAANTGILLDSIKSTYFDGKT